MDHFRSVFSRQRRKTYGHVSQKFDLNASGTAGYDGAELWIVNDTDQHLDTGISHSLNHETCGELTRRFQLLTHIASSRGNVCRATKMKFHCARFSLVK